LVAGYVKTISSAGLRVYMPDYNKIFKTAHESGIEASLCLEEIFLSFAWEVLPVASMPIPGCYGTCRPIWVLPLLSLIT
jgi:hypothetical protein